MTQTQFFKRSNKNISEYKKNFIHALSRCQTVKLFSEEVITFLQGWIEKQTSYIPREDVDNFGIHIDHIYKSKNFYIHVQKELEQVKKSDKIIEYSFNLISQLDESAKKFEDFERKRKASEKLELDKGLSKKEDEVEMERILKSL